MTSTLKCLAVLFLLFASAPPARGVQTAAPLDLKKIEAAADAAAQTHLAGGTAPGITVAVGKDGEVVFARGYGKADVEVGAAAGPETVYGIGSVTKQFTAAIIMRLVEAGKLSLEDPVTKHLPDYPAQGHHLTVRHLLNHTSGIKSFTLGEEDGQLFKRDISYAGMVELFGKQPFDFKPGEQHRYNNTAYFLLGAIINRVTGASYEDYVERELLRPLGLEQTQLCDDRRVIPNRAEGYDYEKRKLVNAQYVNLRSVGAAGALCSTARDLVRWTHHLHGGRVVSPASLRQMTARTALANGETVNYGYGLFVDEFAGRRKVFHGGRGIGFLSLVTHYPESGLTFVVLMNSGGDREKRDKVERALARAAFGIEIQDLPLAPGDLARYEGTYAVQAGSRIIEVRVFAEGGQLKAQPGGAKPTRLRYQGGHAFVPAADDDIRLVFSVEQGRAEAVTLEQEGRAFPGKRKP